MPAGVVEALAERGADRRRGLHDDGLGRVLERVPDLVDLVALLDGAHGADGGALAALHADDVAEVLREGRADEGREAAALGEQAADVLDLVADRDAAAAGDALAGVADERRGAVVDHLEGLLALVAQLADAEVVGQRAQLAVGGAAADLAVAVVLREEQLDDRLAAVAHLAGVGLDDHAVGRRLAARGDQRAGALDLDEADAAGADGLDVLEVAEGGDLHAGLAGRLEDRGALRDLDLDVVNGQGWHPSALLAHEQYLP